MSKKPLCYDCIFRSEVPGSAHSCCEHPATSAVRDDFLIQIAAVLGRLPPLSIEGINVSGHPHGIRMGWFAWPLNFDPVWLESCDGFKAKAESDDAGRPVPPHGSGP